MNEGFNSSDNVSLDQNMNNCHKRISEYR